MEQFKDKETEEVHLGRRPRRFPADVFKPARRRIAAVIAAASLDDLKAPPSNRLHALERDRAGQHAISVNDKYRICFVWTEAGAREIEFTDYH